MKIKKIEWRNFSSYGNRKQEISFGETPSLFQLVGRNGSGKSSISQVITFGLYGKLEGKKLKDIPNRINGSAWVRITLDHNQSEIRVERGLEPNLFQIWVGDKLLDVAGSKSLQDYLAEDILGLPYYVFNNTISLSINDFKSFLKMGVADKRAIIDKIFGFYILNQMRELLKSDLRKVKERGEFLKGNAASLAQSLRQTEEERTRLLAQIELQQSQQSEELARTLETFLTLQRHHQDKVKEYSTHEQNLIVARQEAQTKMLGVRNSIQDLKQKLTLYDNSQCPTCQSTLDSEFHQGLREELNRTLGSQQESLVQFQGELAELDGLTQESSRTRDDLAQKGGKIEAKIHQLRQEIAATNRPEDAAAVESLNRILENLQSQQEETQSELVSVESKHWWMKSIDEILGEKGVKQMAIRTILPPLNQEIDALLSNIGLPHQVHFDEDFNATISHMGMEIPVQTLSTGEMKKMDFIVLISILKLMKIKFNSINLLFLDELFSSVDQEGIHSIVSVLKQVSEDLGLNIFVINHAPMPHEIFDYKIEVDKKNNFSSLVIDRI
jgi:DNA repair exonuclease SbcCD ATPase subunit